MCKDLKPDLFITVTGNPRWLEIRKLLNGRNHKYVPHLHNRIFHVKLKAFLKDIVDDHIFGRIASRVWVIEYQKRGVTILSFTLSHLNFYYEMPHAHICLCLKSSDSNIPFYNIACTCMI